MTLRGKDGKNAISQNVMATFSPEILADDYADRKGERYDHRDSLSQSYIMLGFSIALVPVDESSIMDGDEEGDEETC